MRRAGDSLVAAHGASVIGSGGKHAVVAQFVELVNDLIELAFVFSLLVVVEREAQLVGLVRREHLVAFQVGHFHHHPLVALHKILVGIEAAKLLQLACRVVRLVVVEKVGHLSPRSQLHVGVRRVWRGYRFGRGLTFLLVKRLIQRAADHNGGCRLGEIAFAHKALFLECSRHVFLRHCGYCRIEQHNEGKEEQG
ncbi:MAG: hypothetical protein MR627_05620 [Prevotella sp.]|nr:hypothetical protein [Prevotella sp.]MDD6392690.1 hypothetical protein [Prevotella sp.]